MRWGGQAGGQQRKPPGTGQGGEICGSPYVPQGAKRIHEMIFHPQAIKLDIKQYCNKLLQPEEG